MPGYIVLIRHAATTGGDGRAIGRTPLLLSEEGQRQASELATALGDTVFGSFYTSPALRAQATLAPLLKRDYQTLPARQTRQMQQAPQPQLASYPPSTNHTQPTGQSPILLPELDEIDLGDWDGLPFAEIQRRYPAAYRERGSNMAGFRPPHGGEFAESFNDVSHRMAQALAIMAARPLPALAITHAGCIRSVLCQCTDTPLDDLFCFSPRHARAHLLCVQGTGFSLVESNMPAHAVAAFFARLNLHAHLTTLLPSATD